MMTVFAIVYIVYKIIQEHFEIERIKKNNRLL
jgi:hypothetical protein